MDLLTFVWSPEFLENLRKLGPHRSNRENFQASIQNSINPFILIFSATFSQFLPCISFNFTKNDSRWANERKVDQMVKVNNANLMLWCH